MKIARIDDTGGFEGLLDADEPELRRYAELMVELMPIINRWCSEQSARGTRIGTHIEQSCNIAASIGTSMIAGWMPDAALLPALAEFREGMNDRVDDAIKLAKNKQH